MVKEYTVTIGSEIFTRTGERACIDRILYQEIYTDYADIEFIDDKGNYRHYKSSFDGGYIRIYNAFDLFGFPCSETVLQYN